MNVCGIMSGTSLDGIDVALAAIEGSSRSLSLRTLAHATYPYPEPARALLLEVSNSVAHTATLARLHVYLGHLYAEAVLRLQAEFGIASGQIDCIGCHGQTIFHGGSPEPFLDRTIAATWQIGDASVLAERTGIPVVHDFRSRDIAAGGTGAPLVPLFDSLLFGHPRETRIALNLGGIANITVLPPTSNASPIRAYDTGPGNMVMDQLAYRFSGGLRSYDEDGRIASSGRVNQKLLETLLRDPYYALPGPKSTGREQYGPAFVDHIIGSGLSPQDLMATALDLTTITVRDAVRREAANASVIVAGGGTRNPFLMRRLSEALHPAKLLHSSEFGVDPDAKEALAFAVLAYLSIQNEAGNVPSATGACHPVVLGSRTCR